MGAPVMRIQYSGGAFRWALIADPDSWAGFSHHDGTFSFHASDAAGLTRQIWTIAPKSDTSDFRMLPDVTLYGNVTMNGVSGHRFEIDRAAIADADGPEFWLYLTGGTPNGVSVKTWLVYDNAGAMDRVHYRQIYTGASGSPIRTISDYAPWDDRWTLRATYHDLVDASGLGLSLSASQFTFTRGGNANATGWVGAQGNAPSASRTTMFIIAVPDSGTYRGTATLRFLRDTAIEWDVGLTSALVGYLTFTNGSYTVSLSPYGDVQAAGAYYSGGNKVVTARGSSVSDASGGATVDAEARTAINTLLARVRASTGHGLISG
ncbi:MAG: hypothetical protein ACYC1W_09660 [Gemmatimonadaceae bacterium]